MEEEPVAHNDESQSDTPISTGFGSKLDFMKYFKPNIILSGEQLYNYSRRAEKLIPPKGGHKDFEPDGTWLQDKKINMFHNTLQTLLEEPRFEKQGSLLIGVWDPEKKLVEYKKDARKFWAKMGFVDEKRKWLYPEEALYLMEIKCLEVYDNDIPLSLQKAYHMFLETSSNRNQYQVYAHLRRLGYSVIRHQGRFETSHYERSLKLDQYSTNGPNKKRKIWQTSDACNNSTTAKNNSSSKSDSIGSNNSCKKTKTENSSKIQTKGNDDLTLNSFNDSKATGDFTKLTENHSVEKSSSCETIAEKSNECCRDIGNLSSPLHSQDSEESRREQEFIEKLPRDSQENIKSLGLVQGSEQISSTLSCNLIKKSNPSSNQMENSEACKSWFSKLNNSFNESFNLVDNRRDSSPNFLFDVKKLQSVNCDSEEPSKISMYPEWEFNKYNLPNIACLTRLTFSAPLDCLTVPLFGEPLPQENFEFNIQEYRDVVMNRHRYARTFKGEKEALEFSCLSRYKNQKKKAKNWAEYKKICEIENQEKMTLSPLKVLWEGEVKPLVSPEDAFSTDTVLKKLHIIKHAQLHVCSMANRLPNPPENCAVVFDVYQPNAQFKKTNPGLPYFRVCVCGFDEDPPTVSDVIHYSKYFADDVPMNWAVVDNGEISFYIFRGVAIPERP